MKLRAQLVLAFFLLAVVPLTGVTVYSYVTSQRAFRRAVEVEAGVLAEEMSGRMDEVAQELSRRIDRMRARSHEWRSGAYEQARRDALAAAEREQSRQMVVTVLSLTKRQQGEIPFALDAEGHLYAPTEADRAQLEKLKLKPGADGASEGGDASGEWVVVMRRDAESGLSLGIARPVGESLTLIRRTAVRNLGYGLGMVGLALLGILPLSRRMTQNLARVAEGAEQLARGDLDARVPVRSQDEFGRLAEAFNRMAQELRMNQERLLERERLRKELEMSRRIQEELLPRAPLRSPIAEAKGLSIPAREVGGDFFDYFPLPKGGVALLVGDVSGKGVAAALLMANLQATLRARLPLEEGLAPLAGLLDREIDETTPAASYLTLFMAALDGAARTLRYVNAGHNAPFLLRADGGVEALDSTGRPLGLLPGGPYEERRLALGEGDCLFLYTDGLVEAENPEGEPFGTERLQGTLLGEKDHGPEAVLARVEKALREHRGSAEAADDATMVVLKVGRGAGS